MCTSLVHTVPTEPAVKDPAAMDTGKHTTGAFTKQGKTTTEMEGIAFFQNRLFYGYLMKVIKHHLADQPRSQLAPQHSVLHAA